jgi:YVTN family beta-propeller protein
MKKRMTSARPVHEPRRMKTSSRNQRFASGASGSVTLFRYAVCGFSAICLLACSESKPAKRIYVSNENDGTVSVIDPSAGQAIATIPVGKRPRGLRVSGNRLYVALSGSPKGGPGVDESMLPPADRAADGIGVVDLDKRTLIATLDSGQDPESFDLVGKDTLVVSNEETGTATFVDITARKQRGQVKVGSEPEGVTYGPDGNVWVTSEGENAVTVIDATSMQVVGKVATGLRPRSIGFSKTLAVVGGENDGSVTLIDIKSRTPVARIQLPMGARPMGIAVSGNTAYVTTGRAGGVAVIDLDKRAVIKTIDNVGKRPWGIAIDRDGLIYTANGPSDDISVIDPKAGRIVRRIHTGGSPWGVVAN